MLNRWYWSEESTVSNSLAYSDCTPLMTSGRDRLSRQYSYFNLYYLSSLLLYMMTNPSLMAKW